MKAQKVWFKNGRVYLLMEDGRESSLPIRIFPRLKKATPIQRSNYTLSHFGIHWPEIDEDLSYEGFFTTEDYSKKNNPLGKFFKEYPELNIRQVARSAGINPTLFQQYVDGYKTPSQKRLNEIEQNIHQLGEELTKIELVYQQSHHRSQSEEGEGSQFLKV